MRDKLLELSRKIARVLREVLASQSLKDDSLPMLRQALSAVRLWGLAVILASWELSKPEKSRAELGAVLGRSGVQAFWPQLDLMNFELTPFVVACRDAQSPEEIAEAATRLLVAVHNLGPPLISQVLQSSAFNKSARAIAKTLPEQDQKAQQPVQRKPALEQIYVSPEMEKALAIQNEREQIAISFLLLAGWTRAEAESFLTGKK